MRRLLAYFTLGLTLIWNVAQAECPSRTGHVIFFDFNNAPNEVAAAKRSADKYCRNFHLVKSLEKAKSTLAELNQSNEEITQLILSGHSVASGFQGVNFKLNREQLIEFFSRYPNAKKNLRYVNLWGCYTENFDKMSNWFKTFGPNLQGVYGFVLRSPLDEQIIGATFLSRVMENQEKVRGLQSFAEVKKMLDEVVVPQNQGLFFVDAGVWGRCSENGQDKQFFYLVDRVVDTQGREATVSKIYDFSEMQNQCKDIVPEYQALYKKDLAAYWYGNKPILPLSDPTTKDPNKYPLRRKIYSWANISAYCFPQGFQVSKGEFLDLGQVANLVFFKEVTKNFFNYFSQDIAEAKDILIRNGISTERLDRAEKLSRKEVLSLNASLKQNIESRLGGQATALDLGKIKILKHRINKFLVEMSDSCVDLAWHELDLPLESTPRSCLRP